MDISRGVLDNLMGRDRNLPKNSVHTRDHYSNSDVQCLRPRFANPSLYVSASTPYFPIPSTMRDPATNDMIPTSKPCSITIWVVETFREYISRNASVSSYSFSVDRKETAGSRTEDQKEYKYHRK
jgi:hypothetical protein